MVSVPNWLVKSTRYMTRSATDKHFCTIGLEGKRSKQHFKVVYGLLSKVKLFLVLVIEFFFNHILINFLFL